MLKHTGFLLVLLLLLSGTAAAQNGVIQGTVKSQGEIAAGANVGLFRNGGLINGQQTGEKGNFSFGGLDAGDYKVVIQYTGNSDTIPVPGLGSSETRPLGALNIGEFTLDEVVVEEDIVSKDQTVTTTSFNQEDIETNPTRNLGDLIGLTPGVVQRDAGDGFSVRGGRGNQTETYVDGVRVIGSPGLSQASIASMEVITGGTPPWYGDMTSGTISITTRGPAAEHSFGAEAVSSELTDDYGYNLFALNATGPILKKPIVSPDGDTTGQRPKLSYFIASELQLEEDDDPSSIGVYKVKDDVLADIQEKPLQLGPDGESFINRALLLNNNDFKNVDTKQNNESHSIRVNPRIDYSVGDNAFIRLGGTLQFTENDRWSFNRSMFSPNGNSTAQQETYRGYLRFQQNFNDFGENSLINSVYYNVQFDYTRIESETFHEAFGDNVFEYGHVGQFENKRAEIYQQVNPGDPLYNPDVGQPYFQTAGFIDTALTFDPSTSSNPILANYNEVIIDHLRDNPRDLRNNFNTSLFPPFQSSEPELRQSLFGTQDLLNQGGVINGFTNSFNNPSMNVYSLWFGQGDRNGNFSKQRNELFRATGQATVVLGEQGKNQHTIKAGFEFGQRFNRFFTVATQGLWINMRQLTNRHLQNIDTTFGNLEFEQFNETFLAHADPIADEGSQSNFDRNVREQLGLPVDGTDFVNIDGLDPSFFSLDMFSANEALNNGSPLTRYFGFDYTGDIQEDTPDASFFTDPENRPQDARQPTYLAGYIHDKFQLDRIFLSLGVRIDRYDANQEVLKDPFVLPPTFSAPETAELLGGAELPNGVEDDWVAYVDDRNNPTQILGFRDGNRWFDENGLPTDPRSLEVNGQVQPHVRSDSIGPQSFTDFDPAVNVMPRISFSFPITDQANFFAHYDVLTQRPAGPDQLFFSDYLFIEQNATQAINNPALRPERTVDYEVGFNQQLDPEGKTALKISAFYREMRDMIQIVRQQNAFPITYDSFQNLDFATVKGFTMQFTTRRMGLVRMNTSYTLQFANGTGSSFSSSRGALNGIEGFSVIRSLLPLSFDQRHTITGSIDLRWVYSERMDAGNKGPRIFGAYPFKNLGARVNFNIGSGTPFTRNAIPNQSDVQFGVNSTSRTDGSPFGSRLPATIRLDTRIDKDFKISLGNGKEIMGKKRVLNLKVYLALLNVIDRANVLNVFEFSGEPDNSGFLQSGQGEQAIESFSVGNNSKPFVDQFRIKEQNPNNFSLPRRIRIGTTVNF